MTGLSVKRFRNANEDESLFVPVGIAFESIPQNYRELIDDSHCGFLRDPVGVLTALSDRTSFETLSSWLKQLAESERFGLIVHYAEFCGNIQHELTICCSSLCRQRFLRLPTANIPEWLPKPLYDFYSATDGITESVDAFLTSQFVSLRNLFLDFETLGCIKNSPFSSLAELLAFYHTDTGDYLVADGNNVFAFFHEDCSFHKCGPLLDLLDSYFIADLANARWTPFPCG